jgi:hypothetical protein
MADVHGEQYPNCAVQIQWYAVSPAPDKYRIYCSNGSNANGNFHPYINNSGLASNNSEALAIQYKDYPTPAPYGSAAHVNAGWLTPSDGFSNGMDGFGNPGQNLYYRWQGATALKLVDGVWYESSMPVAGWGDSHGDQAENQVGGAGYPLGVIFWFRADADADRYRLYYFNVNAYDAIGFDPTLKPNPPLAPGKGPTKVIRYIEMDAHSPYTIYSDKTGGRSNSQYGGAVATSPWGDHSAEADFYMCCYGDNDGSNFTAPGAVPDFCETFLGPTFGSAWTPPAVSGAEIVLTYVANYPITISKSTGATPEVVHMEIHEDLFDPILATELLNQLYDELTVDPRSMTITTLEEGWALGQTLIISMASRGVDASFGVISIEMSMIESTYWQYTLTAKELSVAGTFLGEWRELLGSDATSLQRTNPGTSTGVMSPIFLGGSRFHAVQLP